MDVLMVGYRKVLQNMQLHYWQFFITKINGLKSSLHVVPPLSLNLGYFSLNRLCPRTFQSIRFSNILGHQFNNKKCRFYNRAILVIFPTKLSWINHLSFLLPSKQFEEGHTEGWDKKISCNEGYEVPETVEPPRKATNNTPRHAKVNEENEQKRPNEERGF